MNTTPIITYTACFAIKDFHCYDKNKDTELEDIVIQFWENSGKNAIVMNIVWIYNFLSCEIAPFLDNGGEQLSETS
jgi:hypothetical protein